MKTQRHDSLIFDLDGTLWDTGESCAIAWNAELKALGIGERTLTGDDIRSICGLTHNDVLRRLLPDVSDSDRARAGLSVFGKEVDVIRKQGATIYPGIQDGIRKLASRYSLFIVSNCQPEYAELFLDFSGLRPFFKDWETHGKTGLTKAENIRLIVNRNGLRSPIYVGDTHWDQEAAQAAGIPFVFMSYGFGRDVMASRSFSTFSEFADTLMA